MEVSNISSRKIELLLYMLEVKKTTYSILSDYFEVSKRTIMRDIDELINLGVPIISKAGLGGGIFLSSDYIFSKSFFTEKEIESLLIGQYIFDSIRKDQTPNSLIKKLKLLQSSEVIQKEKDLNEYFHIELLNEKVTVKTPICETINEGMDKELFIEIYCELKYVVVPQSYILKNDGLYLFCTDENEYYEIPINMIKKCDLTKIEFIRDDYMSYEMARSQGKILNMKFKQV